MIPFEDFFSQDPFPHCSLWKKGGSLWEPLFHLQSYFKSLTFEIQIPIPEGVFLENQESIFIGEGTKIEPGVLIQGPCYIGKECHLHHGAFLRSHLLLGDKCVIGHGSEVKHSFLFDCARVAHLCYVGDSILGSRVNLGAGVKCSNLRLDQEEISLRIGKKKVGTGLRKMGSILGEGVQVGCNSVLNPGTLVGKESLIYPLVNVGGFIKPHSKVKGPQ